MIIKNVISACNYFKTLTKSYMIKHFKTLTKFYMCMIFYNVVNFSFVLGSVVSSLVFSLTFS